MHETRWPEPKTVSNECCVYFGSQGGSRSEARRRRREEEITGVFWSKGKVRVRSYKGLAGRESDR